jgi:16S rRNA (adenine1518-N6/adenine1519-N6)-dimethyltransferase
VSRPLDSLGAEGARRPGWSAFRAALEAAGFRPSKTLGQNFLIDPNAAAAIAADARLLGGARVLEVGAGCGFLTLHLAERDLDCLAVEIDGRLLDVARRLLEGRTNVRFLHLDVLRGKHVLSPHLVAELPTEGDWHVVANLPYSISAPLLVLLARLPNPPRTMTVLLQDELARRIAAGPGRAEWGALSVRLGLSYRTELGRAVGPQLFWPRPRVASRVLRLERASEEGAEGVDRGAFDALVEHLFQHRRKQVLPLLAPLLGGRPRAERVLDEVGIQGRVRPEALTIRQLVALASSSAWAHRLGP